MSLCMLSHITAWTQGRPLLPALRNSGRFLTIPLSPLPNPRAKLLTHFAYMILLVLQIILDLTPLSSLTVWDTKKLNEYLQTHLQHLQKSYSKMRLRRHFHIMLDIFKNFNPKLQLYNLFDLLLFIYYLFFSPQAVILPFYNSVHHQRNNSGGPKFTLHHGKMSTNKCRLMQNYTWACFKWPKNVDKTTSHRNTQYDNNLHSLTYLFTLKYGNNLHSTWFSHFKCLWM